VKVIGAVKQFMSCDNVSQQAESLRMFAALSENEVKSLHQWRLAAPAGAAIGSAPESVRASLCDGVWEVMMAHKLHPLAIYFTRALEGKLLKPAADADADDDDDDIMMMHGMLQFWPHPKCYSASWRPSFAILKKILRMHRCGLCCPLLTFSLSFIFGVKTSWLRFSVCFYWTACVLYLLIVWY
jgi:hypothetical protein